MGAKWGRVVRGLSPTNSFLLANFGENPSRNAGVRVNADGTRMHADGHTDRQTGFIIYPMLYAIAMRQIKTRNDIMSIQKCTRPLRVVHVHNLLLLIIILQFIFK